jgi:bifunctional DNA-binding transcriptional regulator/antitoxin component of YhaV-PrlF toxin-antitoxin module
MPDDRDRLDAIANPHATIAGKIRALAAAGLPRADIARFLGKRYQHVRNVLEDDAQAGGYVLGKADLSGVQEPGARFEDAVDEREWVERRGGDVYWLRPRPDGSLVLPKEVAETLGLTKGWRVQARVVDDELRIVSGETAMARARDLVRQHIQLKPGESIVDEFIAERRAMWGEDDD